MKKKLDKQKIKSLRQKQHAFSATNQVVAQPFAVFLMLVKCIQEVRAMVYSFYWFTAVRSFLRSAAVFILQIIFSAYNYNSVANHKSLINKEVAYLYLCNYLTGLYFLPLPHKRKIGYNKFIKTFLINRGAAF